MLRDKNSRRAAAADPLAAQDPDERRYQASRCAWVIAETGRHCLMTGTRSRDGETTGRENADGSVSPSAKYCAWHLPRVNGMGAVAMNDLHEWLADYRRVWGPPGYPHSEWTRFPDDLIREALEGRERLPQHEKPESRYEPPATAEAVRAASEFVQECLSKMEQRAKARRSSPPIPESVKAELDAIRLRE